MKKLLLFASAIVALSLLTPITGLAEPTHPNEVGLYLTTDGTGGTGTNVVGGQINIYLVMTKPADAENGYTPYLSLLAFELALHFDPVPNNNLFKLADVLPSYSINVGDSSNVNNGYLEYVVGIATNYPVIVTDESAVLIRFNFFITTSNPMAITLHPTSKPSIPGEMVFIGDTPGEMREMYRSADLMTLPCSSSMGKPWRSRTNLLVQ